MSDKDFTTRQGSDPQPAPSGETSKEAWSAVEPILRRRLVMLKPNERFFQRRAYSLGVMHLVLGILVIALTTAVGGSTLAELAADKPVPTIIVGLVSLVAAVLSALQTFLHLEDRAAKRLVTMSQFLGLCFRIEGKLALPVKERGDAADFLEQVDAEVVDLVKETGIVFGDEELAPSPGIK